MTDDEMDEAIALYRAAAMRCLDSLGDDLRPEDMLAILGLAATSLLRRLPAHQRVPEALRWSCTLVSVMCLDATNPAAVH